MLPLTPGCGPSNFQKHLYQLRDETKKQHTASHIKAAVIPMFSEDRASTNRLPKDITLLPIFSDDPTNIVVVCPLGNTNILSFVIGSGFGHWGIVVCRDEKDAQQLLEDAWHRPRLTSWADGVFFYSEYR
jgi:hypothetical protein